MTQIYCDEAGFSGNNLLAADQPYFVYASVAADPSDAAEFVRETMRQFRLQGGELKAKNLVNHLRGQQAMESVLDRYVASAKMIAWEKRFALASHFFENIFEPVLADQNSTFYNTGFHKFISAILHLEVTAKHPSAEAVFREFHELMRAKDLGRLSALATPLEQHADVSPPMHQILTFAVCHEEKIAQEISSLRGLGAVERWVLDLTFSSLWKLLADWGDEVGELDVYCDESKPLKDYRGVIDLMVGRSQTAYIQMAGERQAATFNLKNPVHIGDSRLYAGLQIADVLAGAAAFCLNNPTSPLGQKWLEVFNQAEISIVAASPQLVDLSQREPFINAGILHYLVERTLMQESLFAGMPKYIEALDELFTEKLENGDIGRLLSGDNA